MKQEDAKAVAILAVTATVIIIGAVMINDIIKGIKAVFGGEDATDKRANTQGEKAERAGYWNPSFIRNPPAGTLLMKQANADIKATNIYKAIGVVYDEPAKVKAAFSNIVTKSQVAFLAFTFNAKYGKDLLTFLRDKMDTDEQQRVLAEIIERCNKLPDYFPAK